MPTYTYETLPESGQEKARVFDVVHRMSDKPLEVDPESGLPVRMVISGGLGIKRKGLKKTAKVDKNSPAAKACGCAIGALCSHNKSLSKK